MPEKVTVTVNEGKVRGIKTKTPYSETEYYAFLGVPFGQPTSGSARFKDPVKVKPWNNILDATVERDGCIQFSLRKKEIIGSEDCLYNNIYTPKIPSKGDPLKAVMVNIHPGSYIHGSPDPWYYGAPDFVMHRDVVYVCTAYRLHVTGLLNLNTKGCSGNQCLKDVILSLKWIKENINSFGGDPENVTIMGSSTGAGLVHFLLLSPQAKGLYHKAIMMGMYIFCPYIVATKSNASWAYEFAQMLGYDGGKDESKKLLNFYKNLDLKKFCLMQTERIAGKGCCYVYPNTPFMPEVEEGENSPLPIPVTQLIPSTNRVPLMIGFSEREAAMALAYFRMEKSFTPNAIYKGLRQNFVGWGADLSDDQIEYIKKKVEDFYLNGEPTETASQSTLCDIMTDAALSSIYDTLIDVISADLPKSVYVYNFHYDGKICMWKPKVERLLETKLKGAFHAADYSYWCYNEELAGKNMSRISPEDREMIEKFTTFLTSFAKTSNPNYEGMNVTWNPSTPDHPSHLVINSTLESRDEVFNGERLEFWHKLKTKIKDL